MSETATQPIVAAIQAGDTAAAERLCKLELQTRPDESDVLLLLALSLQRQNRHAEAVEIHARLTKLNPDSSLHWANYATALRVIGNLDTAEEAFKTSLRLKPDDVDQLVQLGTLQLERREYLDARATLLKAFDLSPDSPAVRIHAAQACGACRDTRAGDLLLKPWREWLPLGDTLQFALAELHMQLADAESARGLLEDLVNRSPGSQRARLLLAGVYERLNRPDDAEVLLQQFEAGSAGLDESMRNDIAYHRARLALRRRQAGVARAILEHSRPSSEADFRYFFALAEACDKAGDTAAAMQALQVAHQRQTEDVRQAASHRFDPDAPILPAAIPRVTKEEYAKWPKLIAPDASQSPVFVVGFPRSGTTLMEQMLDAHPRLQSMDERPFFNNLTNQLESIGVKIPEDISKLNQRDCDEMRKGYLQLTCSKIPRRWDVRLVDKNPLNMLKLPLIHRTFPNAKFILALRHPCDVMLSCYMQNFQSLVLAVSCATLENLAKSYVAAMESWLDHVELFKADVFISRYEDLVADTPGQTRRIAKFLSLDDANSMLRFDARAREKGYIATPSYTQVIEPINTKGLNRWHRYREYFEPVLPILRPMLEHWGYTTD